MDDERTYGLRDEAETESAVGPEIVEEGVAGGVSVV